MSKIRVVGIDIAKSVFQVCVWMGDGSVAWNRKISRQKLLDTLRQFEPGTLIAMEACSTSHFWGRTLSSMGYSVRLIPTQDVNRIARLMRLAELASQTGYRKRQYYGGGKPSVASPNYLERRFVVPTPNTHWVSDMTYIRTHEGWLYLAVVLDLFSRRVIGWSMGGRMTAELVMDALLMAVWRRKPTAEILIHSDQGSQYTSERCQHFMTAHNLKSSMSRRGNCHDNAVAESFFQLLKRERIKKRIYKNREEAKADIFNYVEMFYNAKRRHSACEDQPPAVYESAWFMRHATV